MITIGQVAATHGNRGEVRVLPLTDFPERFHQLDQVFLALEGQLRLVHVETVRWHQHFAVIKFKEVPDMNQAAKLRAALIQIEEIDAAPLPSGHYYIYQLIGLPVYTDEEEHLGQLADIRRTGSNDVWLVHNEETGEEILIPALKEVVREIDLPNRKIVVKLLPGLRE